MHILLAAALLCAQQKTPQDEAIRAYLKGKAAEIEKDFLPGVKSAADFEKLRPHLREQYLYMLGLWPLPEKTPIHATVTGKVEGPGYTVEKLHYQSRPGLYVTCNLYLPKEGKGPFPAILYACGHSNKGRDGNKTAYQDHGIWFASHGYACLVYDTLQLGEIAAIHHGTYREQRWWWHDRGYTPAGVECWNAIRGIDYLATRPEVDPNRIGATGISGGGAATFWISAADERVKVSVPVSGMADLGFYVAEDGVNGHCDCMFMYNTFRWNWTTIAALVCPRPLLFTNSDNDGIFPMIANDRIINRLERIYSHFGASDKVDAMVSVGGHAYRTDLRRAIFEFFNRHLKGDASPVADPDMGLGPDPKTPRIPNRDLRAFPEDKDIPADQLNTKIDETFVPRARVRLPSADGFEAWKKGLFDELRRVSFGAWPSAATSIPISPDAPGQARLSPEPGLEATWRWIPGKGKGPPWLVILNSGEDIEKLPDWAAEMSGPRSSLLATRGIGAQGWTRKNPPNTVERSMALLGATADAGKVWDAMCVARYTAGAHGAWHAVGKGQAGVIAAYAALFEPSIESVMIVDPPASHQDGPHFLNVLRVCDIPEALGLLAPRPLTLVNAKDPAFDRTAEIYKLAGAADKFERR